MRFAEELDVEAGKAYVTLASVDVDEYSKREKEEADRLEWERRAEERRIAAEKAAKKSRRVLAIVTAIIVAGSAFAVLMITVIIPQQKLNKAMRLIDSGDYKAAYLLLDGIDYRNSNELQESIKLEYEKVLLSEAEVGSYIVFGAYEQDNNTSNGDEDIEWIVLAREDDRVLVISRYALDCQRYNASYDSVTWETCTLRKWLNGTFMEAAFSESERAMIPSVTVSADINPNYSTNPGNSTTDQVFLLSITEADKYFSSDSACRCQGTPYPVTTRTFHMDIPTDFENGLWESLYYEKAGGIVDWLYRKRISLHHHSCNYLFTEYCLK